MKLLISIRQKIQNLLAVDRAIAWAVAARGWQFLAGGLSILIITYTLPADIQGYYYSFTSLLAIQNLFDLGLTGVIVYICSHEWSAASSPRNPRYQQARIRLARLHHTVRRWYAICALAFSLVAGLGGYFFFLPQAATSSWLFPWIVSVLLTSFSIWFAPSIALLEGCNQMATVNAYRFRQAILGNLCVWMVMLSQGQLWAVPVSAAVRVFYDYRIVQVRFRSFLDELPLQAQQAPRQFHFSWKEELLPLQWRIALQSLASYFAVGLYTPIIFQQYGPELAGRLGMTWNAINTIQLAAFAWIQTRIPQLGRLLANREVNQSRKEFRRVLYRSCLVYVVGCCLFSIVIIASENWLPKLSSRLLDLETTLKLAFAMGLSHLAISLGTYVRILKIDPFVWIGLSTSLSLGGLAWFLGKQYGPAGLAYAQMVVIGMVSLPANYFIYRRTRRQT